MRDFWRNLQCKVGLHSGGICDGFCLGPMGIMEFRKRCNRCGEEYWTWASPTPDGR